MSNGNILGVSNVYSMLSPLVIAHERGFLDKNSAKWALVSVFWSSLKLPLVN